MLVEALAITIIFFVMIFIFLRAGKKEYALATAPLLAVPIFQIIANVLNQLVGKYISLEVKSLILIVGLAVGVILIGTMSSLLKGNRTKIAYMLTCGGFTTVLAIIFLYNNYSFLLKAV